MTAAHQLLRLSLPLSKCLPSFVSMIFAPSPQEFAVAGQRPRRHPWPQTLRRLAPWHQRHVTSQKHALSGGGR